MKLGAENRKKTAIAIGMMVLSVLLFVNMMSQPLTPVEGSAPAGNTAATSATANAGGRRVPRRARQVPAPVLAPTMDPRLRLDLLKTSEQTDYAGAGRNIFRAEAEVAAIPKPVAPVIKTPPNPGPPPPPPINLRFFGFASRAGEPKKVLLSQGDDVFVAAEGEIVNRRYKVLHIGVNSVEILDVLNNNVQTIPLTQS